jgi:hypothetical protein
MIEAYHPPFFQLSLLSRNATPRTQHYQQIGIFRSPAGVLIATCALDDNPTESAFGVSGTTSQMFRSSDGGQTWSALSAVTGYCAVLFSVSTDMYMMTLTSEYGSVQIRKSTDDGLTWGAATTLLAEGTAGAEPNYYTMPPAPLISGGRVYVPLMNVPNVSLGFAHNCKITLLHAATSADLMVSGSWTHSGNVQLSGGVTTGDAHVGFVEPNILFDKDDNCKIICRVKSDLRLNLSAVIDVTLGASASLAYDTSTGIRTMPGGHVFFKVMIDPVTDNYLSITTRNTLGNAGVTQYNQRTILSLIQSEDLTTWTQAADLVREPQFDTDYKAYTAGWQYCDWIFDGNDIIGIIRVGEHGIAINHHQASAMYFFRIKDYYANLLAPAPANSGTSPSSPYAAVTRNGVAV